MIAPAAMLAVGTALAVRKGGTERKLATLISAAGKSQRWNGDNPSSDQCIDDDKKG